jgi:YggT family protein
VILILISAVDLITRLFILLLFIHVVLTYVMSPFHPIRQRIDQIIEPLLNPIRRMIPTVGMFDFSPLILILLVQVMSLIIKNVLYSLL